MSIYPPYEADLNVLHLIMEIPEAIVLGLLISILEFARGEIELVILHSLDYFLFVLPVGLDLL